MIPRRVTCSCEYFIELLLLSRTYRLFKRCKCASYKRLICNIIRYVQVKKSSSFYKHLLRQSAYFNEMFDNIVKVDETEVETMYISCKTYFFLCWDFV